MIESYLQEVVRWLAGSPSEKEGATRELESHLREADAAGDLEAALDRLGSPREAAAALSRAGRHGPAGLRPRAVAALVDHLPLVIATVVIAVVDVSDGEPVMIAVPAGLRLDGGWGLWNLVTPLALAWSLFGVAFLEARHGTTPGKTLAGIRTIADDGTAVGLGQAIVRRISLTFGPLLWLDVLAVLFTRDRRRVFDLAANTLVIEAPARAGSRPATAPPSPSGMRER